jgi:hypothetical protein
MTVAVDPPLMTLGTAEPTLQVEVVLRQVHVIAPDEQPRLETPHHPGHLLPDRVAVRLQAIAKRLESDATSLLAVARRIEGGRHRDDVVDVPSDRDLGVLDQAEPPIDAPGQAAQERLGTPPLFAARFRWSDWRTSPKASAIRRPGG